MNASRPIELGAGADTLGACVVHAPLRIEPPADTAQMLLLATPQIALVIGIPRV